MVNTNKQQLLQEALNRGLITQDQYQRGLSKLGSPHESSQSKREMLDTALQRGLINDDQYQRGLSNLESIKNPESEGQSGAQEKVQNDPYSMRREEALKKVDWMPQIAKDVYGKYLYPSRADSDAEQRSIAKSARNMATLPGAILDLPMLPINVGLGLAGKKTYVPSQMIGDAIDTATGGYTKPETDMEKVNEAVMQSVLPMGVLSRLGGNLALHTSKWINKPGKFLQSSNSLTPTSVSATAAGSAGAQQYMNDNPEANPFGTLGVGILSSLAGGKLGKNIDMLTNPSAAAARILSVNNNKVLNQLPSDQGGYITSTLGDISDSDNIHMMQHALSKTPFLGKYIKSARQQALDAEQLNLNQRGLDNALPADEAGFLGLRGQQKYQNKIDNTVAQFDNQIEEGLQKHARPHKGHEPSPKNIDKKNAKKNELIDYYTGETEKQLKQQPVNLVPFPESTLFVGKTLKKSDTRKSQILGLDNKFGDIVEKLDDFAKDYDRKGIPYKALTAIRKKIDDVVTTWGQVGNATEGQLKLLRGKIKKDIRNYLESKDPALKDIFDERNEFLEKFIKTEQPHLTHIKNLGDKGDLSAVTKDLVINLKDSGKKVSTIAKGLNDKQKESLGFSMLNEMGKAAEDSNFDMFTFAKNYRQMKGNGKSAFKGLFASENGSSIDRLAKRLGNIQEASRFATNSPTGYINKFHYMVRHPIKSIGGTVGSALALKLYTNKKFLNWVSQGSHIRNEFKMDKHFQKLKKMDLGSQVMNQQIRDMYNKSESGGEKKKKILSITPQKGKEATAEFIEE